MPVTGDAGLAQAPFGLLNRLLNQSGYSGGVVDNAHLPEDWKGRLGPTLNQHKQTIAAMKPIPLCAICPLSEWYNQVGKAGLSGEQPITLECYCTHFHTVMFDGNKTVTACDAFEDQKTPAG